MVLNKKNDSKCVACGSPNVMADTAGNSKPSLQESSSTHQLAGGSTIGKTSTSTKLFKPDTESWECDVCMFLNKKEDTKCVACASPNVMADTACIGVTVGEGIKIPLLQRSPLTGFKLPSVPSSERSSADVTTNPTTDPIVGGIKVPLLQSFTLKAPGAEDISTPSLSSGDSGDGGMKIPFLQGTTRKGTVTASKQPRSKESSADSQTTAGPSQSTHSQQDVEEISQSSDTDHVHVSGEEI